MAITDRSYVGGAIIVVPIITGMMALLLVNSPDGLLNVILEVAAFAFYPIVFYIKTFDSAAHTQNIPGYIAFFVLSFPFEIWILLSVSASLKIKDKCNITIQDISNHFISEVCVAMSIVLLSLYAAIMFYLYQKYILFIVGMSIILVVALGVRLLRLRLFFHGSARDVYETMADLRRRP